MPTVYCFHHHCADVVAEKNKEIRDAWRQYVAAPQDPEEVKKAREEAAQKAREIAKLKASYSTILSKFPWPELLDSPGVGSSAWLSLYDAEDVLWTGEPADTGGVRFVRNFETVATIRARSGRGRGAFTCASVFKPGCLSRSNDNVLKRPYLVLEGDTMGGITPATPEQKRANKEACAAFFKWLMTTGLNLRMVVDSGNKSLHGWFDWPGQEKADELKMLWHLGFDRATFKPSQPVRLPGGVRDNGSEQRILFFK